MATIIIGGTNYEGYADQATADAYLAADFARAIKWASLTEDQKGQTLVSATRRLDRLRWAGEKTDAMQALQFPRTGLVDCDGNALSSSVVPQVIVDASILLAADIAVDSGLVSDTSTESNLKRVKAGSVEVEFFRAQGGAVLSKHLMELVSCLLDGSSVIGLAVAFGTDGASEFDADPYYDRNEGFA